MEGVGLLDAYVVVVDHYEYAGDLADLGHSATAIGPWMRLDGSNPGFADVKATKQRWKCHSGEHMLVCLIISFTVHQYRLTSQT